MSNGPWFRRSCGGCPKAMALFCAGSAARLKRVSAGRRAVLFRRSLRSIGMMSFEILRSIATLQTSEAESGSRFHRPAAPVAFRNLFDSPFTFVYFTITFYYFRSDFRMHITTQSSSCSQKDWLSQLAQAQHITRELLERDEEEQRRLGYFHTLREICQQPVTWSRTAELMREHAAHLGRLTDGLSWVALSGSGSSEFASDCVRPALRKNLGIN